MGSVRRGSNPLAVDAQQCLADRGHGLSPVNATGVLANWARVKPGSSKQGGKGSLPAWLAFCAAEPHKTLFLALAQRGGWAESACEAARGSTETVREEPAQRHKTALQGGPGKLERPQEKARPHWAWEPLVEEMTQGTRPGQARRRTPKRERAHLRGRPEGWELSVERMAHNTRPGQGPPARRKP